MKMIMNNKVGATLPEHISQILEEIKKISKEIEEIESYVSYRIKLEADNMEDDDFVIAFIHPDTGISIMTEQDCMYGYCNQMDFDEAVFVDEMNFFICYDGQYIVELRGNRYLVDAPLMVFDIDEFGNETSIDTDTFFRAQEFMMDNMSLITINGEEIHAIRVE